MRRGLAALVAAAAIVSCSEPADFEARDDSAMAEAKANEANQRAAALEQKVEELEQRIDYLEAETL